MYIEVADVFRPGIYRVFPDGILLLETIGNTVCSTTMMNVQTLSIEQLLEQLGISNLFDPTPDMIADEVTRMCDQGCSYRVDHRSDRVILIVNGHEEGYLIVKDQTTN